MLQRFRGSFELSLVVRWETACHRAFICPCSIVTSIPGHSCVYCVLKIKQVAPKTTGVVSIFGQSHKSEAETAPLSLSVPMSSALRWSKTLDGPLFFCGVFIAAMKRFHRSDSPSEKEPMLSLTHLVVEIVPTCKRSYPCVQAMGFE